MANNKNTPLISVGMPVYNGEQYVAESIESVLAQTQTDFELIISDNASTDGTVEICEHYAKQDSRIVLRKNRENLGAAGNYNLLVELARGEFFRWSNADDLIASNSHELCLTALQQCPSAVLSYGLTMMIDEHGDETEPFADNLHITHEQPEARFRAFFEQYKLTNAIYGLMRTDAVRKTNIFGDGSLPAADISFMAELILLGIFTEIPETLFYRRMHAESSSHDREDDERQQEFWRASGSAFKLPVLRQTGRYLRHAWRVKVPLRSKCDITAYLMRKLVWRRRAVLAELAGVFRKN